MRKLQSKSRRDFIRLAGAAGLGPWLRILLAEASVLPSSRWLNEFGYGDVQLGDCLQQTQFEQTQSVLMELNEDSLLKPFRLRAGMPAPGDDLGGWYDEFSGYDYLHGLDHGFAPGATFGQWISALARGYAAHGNQETQAKINRLLDGYSETIGGAFYTHFRFPSYTYDKLVLALIDAHQFSGRQDAFAMLGRTTDAAFPHLPDRALDRGAEMCSLPHEASGPRDESFCWDESYTMPENLFLAYQRGAGTRYRDLGKRYLKDDTYFTPLADGKNILDGHHAYSYMNALSSGMQAYITLGSDKHLRAARNAFHMIQEQSFATGGWGPDEMFIAPGSGKLGKSLETTHNSFETPCGSYAHFKLTRYLLRITGEPAYGDSMEQVMYNTVLGVKPLQLKGEAFYYSDYNFSGKKAYYRNPWPCCSGTLPQIAADYRISTYFQDQRGIFVNLYIPSTLKWKMNGSPLSLSQSGSYPNGNDVSFQLRAPRPAEFTLRFRIPTWTKDAVLSVNGKRIEGELVPGTFAPIRRNWEDGDRIELQLPRPLRLQTVDPEHPGTVALLAGPLVLFAITSSNPRVTRQQLLAAKQLSKRSPEWLVQTADGASLRMLPFTAIEDEQYSTYLKVI